MVPRNRLGQIKISYSSFALSMFCRQFLESFRAPIERQRLSNPAVGHFPFVYGTSQFIARAKLSSVCLCISFPDDSFTWGCSAHKHQLSLTGWLTKLFTGSIPHHRLNLRQRHLCEFLTPKI